MTRPVVRKWPEMGDGYMDRPAVGGEDTHLSRHIWKKRQKITGVRGPDNKSNKLPACILLFWHQIDQMEEDPLHTGALAGS